MRADNVLSFLLPEAIVSDNCGCLCIVCIAVGITGGRRQCGWRHTGLAPMHYEAETRLHLDGQIFIERVVAVRATMWR